MKKIWKNGRWLLMMLLSVFLITAYATPVFAEEEEEETEFIPEEYYDPIQSNEISGWPQGEAVQSAAAVVMDLDTNTLLYSKNAYTKHYPASITKIMTAMVALENGNLDDVITFSESVYDLEEGSSHVGIQPGEEMTLRQALYALMLESANDAGMGIAEHIAGSISGFADMMNAKALELGCENTHFTNPHGLHSEEHYTCAYDMALIAQAAYNIPEFKEMVSCTLASCPVTNVTEEERYFLNHHKMIQEESDYYTEWCTGGKTGYTSDAWNTLVTYGEKNGRRQVCVVLRVPGSAKTYEDTRLLMNYGFDNFSQISVGSGEAVPTFYEAMKLNYVGKVRDYFQSDLLYQPIAKTMAGTVTLPNGVTAESLEAQSNQTGQSYRTISYSYHGWPVGLAAIEVYPIPTGIQLPFEKELDMEIILQNSSVQRARNEIEATAMIVWNKAQDIYQDVSSGVIAFAQANRMTVVLGGCLILIILLIVIGILISRCTKEARIQNRRRQEEKVRLRKEEEIDQMTTAEIEQELRMAMEEERQKREMEAARLEEERLKEEKLRETERILEEINRKDETR